MSKKRFQHSLSAYISKINVYNTSMTLKSENIRPIIITSECLLGRAVRYNGGHLHQDWLTQQLAHFFEIRPLCPEMRMGLGVPRPAVRLVRDQNDKISMVTTPDKNNVEKDLTDLALSEASKINDEIQVMIEQGLCGLILAKKSPSCGLERVKHYNVKSGVADQHGMGVFAQAITERFPGLPVIDSGRLHNFELRELFIRQAFAYYRFHQLVSDISSLQKFHQQYKYILMEFDPVQLQSLGRIAANSERKEYSIVHKQYRELFLKTLTKSRPTKAKRKNVLYHLLGYFKNDLEASDKEYFLDLMNQYDQSFTPYITLVKMIEHFTKKYQQNYLKDQYYLNPYPRELGLEKFIDSTQR